MRSNLRILSLLTGCCAVASGCLAAPTAAERRMLQAVEAELPAAVQLLERLVNENSGTRNLEGVQRVGELMGAELRALGFDVQWRPMAAAGRAGHVVARHTGRAGRANLLLIGHLDTVFERDSSFQRFERQGDAAHGPGAGDDKGGMVVMLTALKAMRSAGTLRDSNIEIVLSGDEESVGEPLEVARADLWAAGRRADIALDFEGLAQEGGRDMGSIARRSSNSFRLTARGKSAHSSGIFSAEVGDGAVFELARILSAFRAELPEPNLTFNVGIVAGGATAEFNSDDAGARASGKTNIVPGVAVALGDFRTLSAAQTSRVVEKMRAIVARHAPLTSAAIEYKESYPAMAPTAGNRALLEQLNQVNRDLGLPLMGELDPLKRGAGDIAFVAQDVDGLVGLGTVSTGDHTLEETVDLVSIERQAKRAAVLMSRLSRQPSRKSR